MSVETRSLADCVGRTPLVRAGRSVPPGAAEVLLKIERRNPGGSLRDRVVLFALDQALEEDRLDRGGAVVAAAGEDGAFSAALLCAVRGHPLTLFMPADSTRPERRRAAARFGATIREVGGGLEAARAAAADAAKTGGALIDIESASTAMRACAEIGREILEAVDGELTAFVAAVRSGGTLEGVSGVLHARVKRLAIHPVRLEGFTRVEVDGMVDVTRAQALAAAGELARNEGLLVGPASGAGFHAGRDVAKKLGAGARVVVLCSDPGDRWLLP